jgi:hypothetical protein
MGVVVTFPGEIFAQMALELRGARVLGDAALELRTKL